MSQVQTIKVCVLGDGNVGKSALTIRYFQDQFVEDWDPTIEDLYTRKDIHNGIMYSLEVQDTAGQQNYSTLRDMYIRESQGFAIIFSVCEPSSFDNVEAYYNNIRQHHTDVPILLVANKIDLTNMRKVAPQQVEEKARQLKIPFKETSAKTKYNVEEAFLYVVGECLSKAAKEEPEEQMWPSRQNNDNNKETNALENERRKKSSWLRRIKKNCTIS